MPSSGSSRWLGGRRGIGAGNDNLLLSLAWVLVSLVLNLALFLLAFRILTSADVSWETCSRAPLAAIAWTALQALGGYFVRHQLEGATETYGTFATVIGLLAWMYLGAQAAARGRGQRRAEAAPVAARDRAAAAHRRGRAR